MTNIVPKSAFGLFIRTAYESETREVRRLIRKQLRRGPQFSVSALGPDFSFYLTPKSRLSLSRAWEIARTLSTSPDILYAEVDVLLPSVGDPDELPGATMRSMKGPSHRRGSNDPEWSLKSTRVPWAWKDKSSKKRFGEGIRVGHPDTGYTEHPEIFDSARLLSCQGYDFEDGKPDPVDPLERPHPGHGTSTASVIMSGIGPTASNAKWVSGAAPAAQLVPLRVSNSVVHLRFKNVVLAIYKAVEQGCHIISMSLGGPLYSRALDDAVRFAEEQGVIVLAAAGNVYPWVVYPAKLDTVIAVAAVNCDDAPWKKSAKGKTVNVSAPGESVWRAKTDETGQFMVERSSGTSYAVATLAGICALWLAHHGRRELIKRFGRQHLSIVFRQILETKGHRIPSGWNSKKYGAGIVDAKALLETGLPKHAPVVRFRGLSTVSLRPNSIDEIADYFPSIPTGRLVRVLEVTLGAKADELAERLEAFGDELRFHIATNPAFRAQLAVFSSPKRRRFRGVRGVTAKRNVQFVSQSSKELQEQLKMR